MPGEWMPSAVPMMPLPDIAALMTSVSKYSSRYSATLMVQKRIVSYIRSSPISRNLRPIFMSSLPDQVSQPEDMANAVAFLASDEARYVTGVQLPVDLGTLAR